MRPPPGYPFPGPLASRPPPGEAGDEPSRAGLAAFIVTFAAAMTGLGFLLAALVVAQGHRLAEADAVTNGPMGASPAASTDSDHPQRLVDEPLHATPPVARNVPVYPARFLEGCGTDDLDTIEAALNLAISTGAPLYNDGDAEGCATTYEKAAKELAAALPAACNGPTEALTSRGASASGLSSANARAWAFRDTFDGLLEIVDRSRSAGGQSL